MTDPLLNVEELSIAFRQRRGELTVVRDVRFDVGVGEVVGLVGESGSGKSVSCRSILRLMPAHGVMRARAIEFLGRDVTKLSDRELRDHRRHNVGMVFQDPYSCLNPTQRVGEQVAEALRVNAGMSKIDARARTIELFESVGIDRGAERQRSYPHELSGGMRQRVMIAIAISAGPKLLIGDEPTTALDVTTQAQILALMSRLRDDTGMAVLLVSHDFGVVAQVCDRVVVMYGGRVMESGPVTQVCTEPQHPYTRALLESIPRLEAAGRRVRREGIPGQPPNPADVGEGCPFADRCAHASARCSSVDMSLRPVGPSHVTACPFVGEWSDPPGATESSRVGGPS